ncbi:restriction endonuclease subunit S [Enterococcus casseliflavus]|uniref:restriction endonuclease subunit S n=1 Tax=Enterococcus casseliflavus TaxID=37734 RepID=UPI00188453D8|nr:restriction endonuclease subunit S [Enterococcus casseliflavus]MBE9881121.1 restriction endonuclease subunit S [Enterococcus casseliflavus]MCD5162301.1 restriction endonuclease subunit S [Enterococcus casseliflavus]MDT2962836.1 restriction endonuclease subunit S [Enterococcus casseliflavus]MDT2975084.1 restriction endonuclease subunit S [Enterococcus casseliflavus]
MSNDTRPEIRFPGFTEDWEQRKFGEMLVNLEAGVSVNSSDYDTGYFILKTSAIKMGNIDLLEVKSIVSEEVARAKTPLIKNSIIISRMNTPELVGASGLVRESIDNIFLPDRLWQGQVAGNFSPEWLIQSINIAANIKKIRDLATGTSGSMKNISKKSMLDLIINVPTLEEQQKIGSFFKQLDDVISLHQLKLDLLKEQKKGFLQKMFPKNGAKVPEIRFPGFTKDWEERKLGSIYDFSKGKGLPLNSFTYSKDDPAIAYGHLYTKYSEVISEVYLSSDDDGVLSKDNDLLFPGSSTVPNGTAQANAIMLNNVKLGGDIIIARPKQDTRVLSIFMSYQINSQRQKLFPITVGTTITHMYGKDLSKVKFFITNYSEQQKIGSFFKQLDDTIALHQRELDLLKETKKGFLQKMFV